MRTASTIGESKAEYIAADRHKRDHSTRNGLLCAFIVAIYVLIAYPVANTSFMDEFSYDKTALEFARTGHLVYNGWATAMLGWQVPWGALFIKLFGFSFTMMRLSMLPIDMAAVYLFHQILRRFGINSQNSILGALTMALSPLFLPMAASFMTDIPGLLVILVCIYMCQRAIAASSDRNALVWLCSAMAVNVAGGTVRQIAWLGALVMVPSTAWLLRKRRGMMPAGVLLWISSLIAILACLHWFNQQPYSVPEHILAGPIRPKALTHLVAQQIKTFLCLLLVIFPITAAWLPATRQLNRHAWIRLGAGAGGLALFAIILYREGSINGWMMPWLIFLLAAQWNMLPDMFGITTSATFLMRSVISLFVIAPALVLAEHTMYLKRTKRCENATLWNEIAWVLGPFSLSYVMLLSPRGAFFVIYDRYVLGLVPIAIVVLLLLYQERVAEKVSKLSFLILSLVALVSVGATHDFYADSRALVNTLQLVQKSGVPRRSIEAGLMMMGWASDGWVQIERGGHINGSLIQVPAGAYDPKTPDLGLPTECTSWMASSTPVITPKYFLVSQKLPCFDHAKYPPVHYRAWLPPFDRAIYVQQLRKTPPPK